MKLSPVVASNLKRPPAEVDVVPEMCSLFVGDCSLIPTLPVPVIIFPLLSIARRSVSPPNWFVEIHSASL